MSNISETKARLHSMISSTRQSAQSPPSTSYTSLSFNPDNTVDIAFFVDNRKKFEMTVKQPLHGLDQLILHETRRHGISLEEKSLHQLVKTVGEMFSVAEALRAMFKTRRIGKSIRVEVGGEELEIRREGTRIVTYRLPGKKPRSIWIPEKQGSLDEKVSDEVNRIFDERIELSLV